MEWLIAGRFAVLDVSTSIIDVLFCDRLSAYNIHSTACALQAMIGWNLKRLNKPEIANMSFVYAGTLV